jgi:hypothetical protein
MSKKPLSRRATRELQARPAEQLRAPSVSKVVRAYADDLARVQKRDARRQKRKAKKRAT